MRVLTGGTEEEHVESQAAARERMALLNLFSRIKNPAFRRALISLARTLAESEKSAG